MNDRLLTAAELGDALTITKLVKRSILLDVNVRDQPFGETALAKAVRGIINPLYPLNPLYMNYFAILAEITCYQLVTLCNIWVNYYYIEVPFRN